MSSILARRCCRMVLLPQERRCHPHRFSPIISNSVTNSIILPKPRLQFATLPHHPFSSTSSQNPTNPNNPQNQNKIPKRRLDIAIVGAPNAGKSQLLNTLTSTPIAAVSRKRHTTRESSILATHYDKTTNTQLVFIDTPGFVTMGNAREEKLYKGLVDGASGGMEGADYTLVVVDAASGLNTKGGLMNGGKGGKGGELEKVLTMLMLRAVHCTKGRMEGLVLRGDGTLVDGRTVAGEEQQVEDGEWEEMGEKFAIVLNKVDLVNPKKQLLELAREIGLIGDACVRYKWDAEENETRDLTKSEDNLSTDTSSSSSSPSTNQQPSEQSNNNNNNNHTTYAETLTPTQLQTLEASYPPVFYTSALSPTDIGTSDLLTHLLSRATPALDFAIPPEHISPLSTAERIESILREKIYRCLHREVPHAVRQVNRGIVEGRRREDGRRVVRIDQDLVVGTKSHVRLVNGRGGMTLRRIGESAKRDLILLFNEGKGGGEDSEERVVDVVLNLHVKWTRGTRGHERELVAEREGVTQRYNV